VLARTFLGGLQPSHLISSTRLSSVLPFTSIRILERSTRLYETPPPKNEPPTGPPSADRVQLSDPNYMSTFHQGAADVKILDMRSPGALSMRRLELDRKRVGRDGRCQCVVRCFRSF
jgi:hypothetical protein